MMLGAGGGLVKSVSDPCLGEGHCGVLIKFLVPRHVVIGEKHYIRGPA